MRGQFYGFSRTVRLCGDIRSKMVEHEKFVYLLWLSVILSMSATIAKSRRCFSITYSIS